MVVEDEEVLEDGRIMKNNNIAIGLNDENVKSEIALHFGRSDYFLLYNPEKGISKITKNPYSRIMGGAGIQAAQFLIEMDVDVLIVGQVGRNANVILESAGISVVYQSEVTGEDALQNYIKNKIMEGEIQHLD